MKQITNIAEIAMNSIVPTVSFTVFSSIGTILYGLPLISDMHAMFLLLCMMGGKSWNYCASVMVFISFTKVMLTHLKKLMSYYKLDKFEFLSITLVEGKTQY